MTKLHKDMTIQQFVEWCKENNVTFFEDLSNQEYDIAALWISFFDDLFEITVTNTRDFLKMLDYYLSQYPNETMENLYHDLQTFFNDNKSDLE